MTTKLSKLFITSAIALSVMAVHPLPSYALNLGDILGGDDGGDGGEDPTPTGPAMGDAVPDEGNDSSNTMIEIGLQPPEETPFHQQNADFYILRDIDFAGDIMGHVRLDEETGDPLAATSVVVNRIAGIAIDANLIVGRPLIYNPGTDEIETGPACQEGSVYATIAADDVVDYFQCRTIASNLTMVPVDFTGGSARGELLAGTGTDDYCYFGPVREVLCP